MEVAENERQHFETQPNEATHEHVQQPAASLLAKVREGFHHRHMFRLLVWLDVKEVDLGDDIATHELD